ncbi:protein of unknown function DUF500 [Candidatus Koribacter versatilis Ellin345]|uniref:Ysc84 actin-binding domain-containing protein n=1 Tax=Koribacter versatilis (strain Ellin345) TaxID=204669 RepID=Q1INT5_KORVE|nr:lipid-binding SYLF domain-containing protein [Candidatus Koribacter versatilis]ABF41465.1 protein of unknown function DUF500 [Candidatus Koribacter versatilis Ellin345]
MKTKSLSLAIVLALSLPALAADKKMDQRISESTDVLKAVVGQTNGIPHEVLNKSVCVLVFPRVKKVGIGIGVSYGRGLLTCRTGTTMSGKWSAPAMYSLDTGSLGVQLGGSSTDFVLLVMNQQAANKALSGKLKLGSDASANAGPSGAKAVAVDADIYTYSRAKEGLFAGASLGSASMEGDNDANKSLYGKSVDATQIVRDGQVTTPASGQPLIALLDSASPKHM